MSNRCGVYVELDSMNNRELEKITRPEDLVNIITLVK